MVELMWGTWGMGHGWIGSGMPFGAFFGLAVLLLGLWLVFGHVGRWERGGANRAREILDERYAAGEISTDDYRERLEHLRRG